MTDACRYPDPRSPLVIGLITALVALGQIATALYIPSMPALAEDFATDAARVNLTMTVFFAGFAVSQVVHGPLSDRLGRRPVLLGALGLFLAASVACALAPTIEVLIVSRFVQAVGACAGQVIGRAVVRDAHERHAAARVFATIGIAFAISPAVTPAIGGLLQEWWGWRASFAALSVIALMVLAASWRLLAETNREPDPMALDPLAMARAFGGLLGHREYVGYLAVVSLIFAGLMAYTVVSPFLFIETLGLSPPAFGLLAVFNVTGFVVGTLAARSLVPRLGVERLVLAGIGFALLGGLAMTGITLLDHLSVVAVIGPMIVFLVGFGLVMPNGTAGAMAPFPRRAGAASALLGFAQMATAALASGLIGALPHGDQLPLGLLIAGTAGLALLAFWTLVWRRVRADRRPGAAPGA